MGNTFRSQALLRGLLTKTIVACRPGFQQRGLIHEHDVDKRLVSSSNYELGESVVRVWVVARCFEANAFSKALCSRP